MYNQVDVIRLRLQHVGSARRSSVLHVPPFLSGKVDRIKTRNPSAEHSRTHVERINGIAIRLQVVGVVVSVTNAAATGNEQHPPPDVGDKPPSREVEFGIGELLDKEFQTSGYGQYSC